MLSRFWKLSSHRPTGRLRVPLRLEVLEDRTLPATELFPAASVSPIDLLSDRAGELRAEGEEDFFSLAVAESGRLTVKLSADVGSGLDPRLTLFTGDGQELVRSDDVS